MTPEQILERLRESYVKVREAGDRVTAKVIERLLPTALSILGDLGQDNPEFLQVVYGLVRLHLAQEERLARDHAYKLGLAEGGTGIYRSFAEPAEQDAYELGRLAHKNKKQGE